MSQDLLSNIILGATKPFRTGANILAQNYGSAFTGKDMSQKENQGLFLQYLASALTPEEQKTIREKPYLSAVKSGAGMAATLAPFGANSLRAMQYTANPLANRLLQLGSQGALEGGMGGFGLSREGKEVQDTLAGVGLGIIGEIAGDYLLNPETRNMINYKIKGGKPQFGSKTGMSDVDQIFNREAFGYYGGKKVPLREYMEKAKGKRFLEVKMTPEQYLDEARKLSDSSLSLEDYIKTGEGKNTEKYMRMLAGGTKMDMPWLQYSKYGGQEGRHRAVAAMRLGMKEIPVLVEYDKYAELPGFLLRYLDPEYASYLK